MRLLIPCMAIVCGCALAAPDDEHPNFSGNWLLEASRCELHSKLELTSLAIHQDDTTIAIDEQMKNKTVSLKCGTDGKNCKATPEGESGEVMFYYNGDILVETDFLGHSKEHVVKKRLKLGADHKTLEIEVMHLTPFSPPEKWVFAKQ
jgi:hypothetical protein